MAIGDSGRIVLEIDPDEKQALYAALAKEGLTLKNWFLRQVDTYLREGGQLSLFDSAVVAERPSRARAATPHRRPARYSTKKKAEGKR
jgi:hypothetical protein